MSRRRFKSSTMKFGVPLSVPSSRYVGRCYGKHGKGFTGRISVVESDYLDAVAGEDASILSMRLIYCPSNPSAKM